MVNNGQAYFKNLVVLKLQDFKSMSFSRYFSNYAWKS